MSANLRTQFLWQVERRALQKVQGGCSWMDCSHTATFKEGRFICSFTVVQSVICICIYLHICLYFVKDHYFGRNETFSKAIIRKLCLEGCWRNLGLLQALPNVHAQADRENHERKSTGQWQRHQWYRHKS